MKPYESQTPFLKKALTCLLCVGSLASLPAQAATIATGVVTVANASNDESLINVTGTVVLAANLGGSDALNTTINGVVFHTYWPNGSNFLVGSGGVTLQGTSVTGAGSAWRNLGYPLWSGGAYGILFTRLLDNQSGDPTGTVNLSITGLDAGTLYRVQAMSGDNRNLGTLMTHTLGGVSQSSILQATADGMISSFTVSGETSVNLTVTSNLVGGTPPTIQGLLVTSIGTVPEPGSSLLTAFGATALLFRRRRKL